MRLVETQILHIVANLNKKNFKSSCQELNQLLESFGCDAHIFLIKCLFRHINIADGKGGKDQLYQTQLLSQELSTHFDKEYLQVALSFILEGSEHSPKGKFPSSFLPANVKASQIDGAARGGFRHLTFKIFKP